MKREKLWNANYNRVMFTNFSLFFSFYLLTPLMALYMSETFGSSKETIGLVLSGYTLVALLMRPFSGFVVDSFPRKKVLLICLMAYFVMFGGYLVSGSLVLFAVVRTLHGGPFGASTVANSTMAIDVLPSSRRNEGIGFYGLSNNLASAIAPSVGIFIYQYVHNFDLLFGIAFVVAGLGVLSAYGIKLERKVTAPILPEDTATTLPSEQVMANLVKTTRRRAVGLDRFFLTRGWFLAVNIVLFGFCWGVLSNYLAIYGKEHLGITSGTGAYFMLLSIGLIVSRLQGNKALREGRMTRNALVGILLSTVGFTLFIAYPSMFGYYASAILVGLGNGHMWPAFQNMIIMLAHNNERGTANSTLLTSWDLGLGLGILLGGVVAEFFGYDAAFWMMAAVHVVGLAMYLLVTKKCYLCTLKTMSR